MIENSCFVVSPIGEEGTATRKRADAVFKHVIKPSVATLVDEVVRADHISDPGIITNQIISRLLNSKLVVADLSERNPNVFYEVAVRQAARLPMVLIIQKGERIPFDLTGMRVIPLDHADLDDVENVKAEIERQARSELNKPQEKIESPISTVLQLSSLFDSGDAEKRQIAGIAEQVGSLLSNFAQFQSEFDILKRRGLQLSYGGKRAIADIERLLESLTHDLGIATSNKDKSELLEHVQGALQQILFKMRRSE